MWGGYWDVVLAEKGSRIVGAMPFYVKKKYGLKYITQPPMTQHNGIWLEQDSNSKNEKRLSDNKAIIENLLSKLEARDFSFYQQNYSPNFDNWLPLFWRGYEQRSFYTFIIKNKNYEEVEKLYSKVIRYDIRKAKEFATVEQSHNLEAFHKLHTATFERQGKKPSCSFSLLKKIDEHCADKNARVLLLAKDSSGNYCSGAYFIKDSKCMYYILSGTDTAKRKFNTLSLILSEAIRYACDNGLDFDFEGSRVEQIFEYFRKFGGELIPYYNIRKIYSTNFILRMLIQKRIQGIH